MIINERQIFDCKSEGPFTVLLITVFTEENQSQTPEVWVAKRVYQWYEIAIKKVHLFHWWGVSLGMCSFPWRKCCYPKFALFFSVKEVPLLDLKFIKGVSSSQQHIQFDQLPKVAMASQQKQKFIQIYDILYNKSLWEVIQYWNLHWMTHESDIWLFHST